jgi:hypothetical protein
MQFWLVKWRYPDRRLLLPAPRPEGTGDRSEGGSGGHNEESRAIDPHEAKRSYDFGPSTVTVGRI